MRHVLCLSCGKPTEFRSWDTCQACSEDEARKGADEVTTELTKAERDALRERANAEPHYRAPDWMLLREALSHLDRMTIERDDLKAKLKAAEEMASHFRTELAKHNLEEACCDGGDAVSKLRVCAEILQGLRIRERARVAHAWDKVDQERADKALREAGFDIGVEALAATAGKGETLE